MEHLDHRDILEQGVGIWNKWREANPKIQPQLAGTILPGANLRGANLTSADLRGANLQGVDLSNADLRGAYIGPLDIYNPIIMWYANANLSNANLSGANLTDATLNAVNLSRANLSEANLRRTKLYSCRVYAISAWNTFLENTEQSNLVISREDEPSITVDDIEVAQFIHLLLNNQKIRHVINTVTAKTVLILGNFSEKRKIILDALREDLRKHDLLPILFDFEKPERRNYTETIKLLAGMSRFILADLTSPRSIPQELYAVIPHYPSIPIQPLIYETEEPYAMFEDLIKGYPWVLTPYCYKSQSELLTVLPEIIANIEQKIKL